MEGMPRDVDLNLESDINQFEHDTNGEDALQIILRGHLYIEREITALLKFRLEEEDHEEIFTSRFLFYSKLNWAVALGLIKRENKLAYKNLNDIRNSYAHELGFQLDDKRVNDVVSAMSRGMREEYKKKLREYPEKNAVIKVKLAISVLWHDLKKIVHGYEEEKRKEFLLDELKIVNQLIDELEEEVKNRTVDTSSPEWKERKSLLREKLDEITVGLSKRFVPYG